jgi:hypothetical protein
MIQCFLLTDLYGRGLYIYFSIAFVTFKPPFHYLYKKAPLHAKRDVAGAICQNSNLFTNRIFCYCHNIDRTFHIQHWIHTVFAFHSVHEYFIVQFLFRKEARHTLFCQRVFLPSLIPSYLFIFQPNQHFQSNFLVRIVALYFALSLQFLLP